MLLSQGTRGRRRVRILLLNISCRFYRYSSTGARTPFIQTFHYGRCNMATTTVPPPGITHPAMLASLPDIRVLIDVRGAHKHQRYEHQPHRSLTLSKRRRRRESQSPICLNVPSRIDVYDGSRGRYIVLSCEILLWKLLGEATHSKVMAKQAYHYLRSGSLANPRSKISSKKCNAT